MPHPRRLERATIVAATIDVLNERGLDELSLHTIAQRLGVRQPALYHHFPSKSALLDATAAEVLDRWHTERLPQPGEAWREFLARNAYSLRRALLTVRDGARLVAATGPRAPEPASALARIEFLEHHGFTAAGAVLASIAVSRYVLGCVLEQQLAPTQAITPSAYAEQPPDRLQRISEEIVRLGPDHEFDVGLQALLRGLL
ncbi:TetR/AcrR family transcriptional regulator C-terminal domain-containing protein [Hamadaea tsunoensis]|uniref:TetR/AcrR family transcriptional regulator C-terminal domain-containing protein n=1 Tax=Hamadaea tsunoensis TaxID=53368 RepID=UPI00041EFAF6|nr:TetR/AcrR family transcriptional regulator C-terminal domain-containing protein [Hamadaea tsunoensis]